MSQPKAKWTKASGSEVWSAFVGPFYLEVNPPGCSLREVSTLAVLWEHIGPVPCDAPDLMRLTEAELARRLEGAAETMDGGELVGEPATATPPAGTIRIPQALAEAIDEDLEANRRYAETTAWGDKMWGDAAAEAGPRFKVGDRVTAKPFTRLRDTMIAAVGTITATAGDCAIVKFARNAEVRAHQTDLELYEAATFKVGDLVRTVDFGIGCVVAVNTTGPQDWWLHEVRFDSLPKNMWYPATGLQPYTLPPITSYADLADVLDELPKGWRVKMAAADGWFIYRRDGDRYESKNDLSEMGFTRLAFVAIGGNVSLAKFSVLPPEGGK